MTRLFRIVDLLIAPLMLAGEAVVALMCLHIVAEIVANAVFHSPIEGTIEAVAYWYMVAIVFLPLAFIQHRDAHIKAELFTNRLRPRARALLDALIGVLMLAMTGLLAWYAIGDAVDATARGDRIELMSGVMEVWPTRWLVAVGFVTMAAVALLQTIKRFGDAVLGETGAPSGGSA